MRTQKGQISRHLARTVYITLLAIVTIFMWLVYGDYSSACGYFSQNLRSPIKSVVKITNSTKMEDYELRGNVLGFHYFSDNKLIVFSSNTLTCAGYYHRDADLNDNLWGYHVTHYKLYDTYINCVPMDNQKNWKEPQKFKLELLFLTSSVTVLALLAGILIVCNLDGWCECKVNNSFLYRCC